MRIDEPRTPTPALVRHQAHQAWRWVMDQSPGARLAAGALALAALVGAAYSVTGANPDVPTTWLYDGQSLASEDSQRVLEALAVAKIPATVGSRGQVAVPAEHKSDALALLAKNKLGPKTLSALQSESETSSPFASPVDRVDRKERQREREAEILISRFEGISSAYVKINRASGRSPATRAGKVAVLVSLELREEGRLPPRSLEAIQNLIKTTEPDLPPDALTVMDKTGRSYLAVGKPEVGVEMMAQIREEEFSSRIRERLNWIEGVQVYVSMDPGPALVATPDPMAQPAPNPPVASLNTPAEIVEAAPAPVTIAPQAPPPKARVLVQVPVNHYLRAYEKTNRAEPTLDELRPYAMKIESSIRSTIQTLIPPSQLAEVEVMRIDDPGPAPPPSSKATPPGSPLPSWAIPAGIAAAVGFAAALLLGTRWLVARRPPVAAPSAVPRAHFEVGDDAGPSNRVRELVKRDPAAAAGVLHRWIGQGGDAS